MVPSYYRSKMKIRRSDAIFSEYIRRRDVGCVYKFKCSNLIQDWKSLQASHWQGRRHEGTRFDPDNVDASCAKCHAWITDTAEGAKALDAFKLNQLGQQRYNMVLLRANSYSKKDEFLARLYAKELLNSLDRSV